MKMLVVIELIGIAESSHSQLNSLYVEIIIEFKLKNASNRSAKVDDLMPDYRLCERIIGRIDKIFTF